MKSKKTNKANLEKKKPTLLLIGMTLSIGLVLESFEWINPDFQPSQLASRLSEEIAPENIIEVDLEVPKKKTEVQPQKTKTNVVTVTKTPIVAPGPVVVTKKAVKMPEINWDDIIADDGGDVDVDIDTVFTIVEEMPEFPGGIKALYSYLGENIKYPDVSAEAHSQGKAYVNFTIEKNGKITDVKIIAGDADYLCKKEAERVVSEMPKWKPGKQRGKKVRVSYTLPVRFVLAD